MPKAHIAIQAELPFDIVCIFIYQIVSFGIFQKSLVYFISILYILGICIHIYGIFKASFNNPNKSQESSLTSPH